MGEVVSLTGVHFLVVSFHYHRRAQVFYLPRLPTFTQTPIGAFIMSTTITVNCQLRVLRILHMTLHRSLELARRCVFLVSRKNACRKGINRGVQVWPSHVCFMMVDKYLNFWFVETDRALQRGRRKQACLWTMQRLMIAANINGLHFLWHTWSDQ